jgi:hypothetical protein
MAASSRTHQAERFTAAFYPRDGADYGARD